MSCQNQQCYHSWIKNTLFCSQFSPLNTGNCILGLWNSKIIWGGGGGGDTPRRYQLTNSPNWSPYIALKNELREFDKRSKIFLFKIILLILVDFALDNLWLSLGENWFWTLLGHKGLIQSNSQSWGPCISQSNIQTVSWTVN